MIQSIWLYRVHTSWTMMKMNAWSLATRNWNFNLNHHRSLGTFGRIMKTALHSVQWEKAKPSLVDLQLSRHDLWTYFWVPLQWQGAIKSSPPRSRQIRHCGWSASTTRREDSLSSSLVAGIGIISQRWFKMGWVSEEEEEEESW